MYKVSSPLSDGDGAKLLAAEAGAPAEMGAATLAIFDGEAAGRAAALAVAGALAGGGALLAGAVDGGAA
ncbi:MAG: hypothetical protein JO247_11435 [Chloroflexi bacterium]|nr:hypothetical protein [Chloroflexota bacterium]